MYQILIFEYLTEISFCFVWPEVCTLLGDRGRSEVLRDIFFFFCHPFFRSLRTHLEIRFVSEFSCCQYAFLSSNRGATDDDHTCPLLLWVNLESKLKTGRNVFSIVFLSIRHAANEERTRWAHGAPVPSRGHAAG